VVVIVLANVTPGATRGQLLEERAVRLVAAAAERQQSDADGDQVPVSKT